MSENIKYPATVLNICKKVLTSTAIIEYNISIH